MLDRTIVIENFIAQAVCEAIIDSLDPASIAAGKVVDKDGNELTIEGRKVDKYTNYDHALVHQAILAAIDNVLSQFDVEIEMWARPEILHYMGGGEYEMHCDSEVFDPDTQSWLATINRDISFLLYLNENFLGGNLEFEDGHSVEPKTGMLVLFPSDRSCAHAARPVISGDRYAVVSWMVAKGSARKTDRYDPHLSNRNGAINW